MSDRDAMKRGESTIATVEQVTIEHGLAFAQGWYDGDISDACDDTEIMAWPDDDAGMDQKEAQARFHDLSDEICANVFALVKQQIAEAFVSVANEVLTRERSREERHSMNSRSPALPIVVFIDSETRDSRCINGLHVQTLVPNPLWNGEPPRGTLVTFASGETVTVTEDFDEVVKAFLAGRQDG
jgi:hypothetical protein